MKSWSITKGATVPALILLLLLAGACSGYGNVMTSTETIDQGNASSATATLEIGAGQINVAGGADAFAETHFTTNNRLKPKVSYSIHGSIGSLSITQPVRPAGFNLGPITNRWSIDLNDDVPLALTVTSSSARVDLSLDTLTVTSLEVSSDSGEQSISLSGSQRDLKSVSLRSTSGSIHVTLDGDYQQPTKVDVDSSNGDISAKLDGKWTAGATGTFKTDSGSITLTVPKDIGVEVNASTDTGYIDAKGFTNRGQDTYINEAAKTKPITMRLDVQTSDGIITIRTGG